MLKNAITVLIITWPIIFVGNSELLELCSDTGKESWKLGWIEGSSVNDAVPIVRRDKAIAVHFH